jgi:hypothetical protein
MKITVFTSNNLRHNFLIKSLLKVCTELYVIQENKTIFPNLVTGQYKTSSTSKKYFNNVNKAQQLIFKDNCIKFNNKKIHYMPLGIGDLNFCTMDKLKEFLKSDLYIVFGSSYIKNDLAKFLVRKKAINIHMGISPFYRGTDCNFWALFDNNPHLVGATIHRLSLGLDSGPILYHALSTPKKNLFLYSMNTVYSAITSLTQKINDRSIFDIRPKLNNKSELIRYSRKKEFNDSIINKFYKLNIDMQFKFNNNNYINPFILKNIIK